MNFTVDLEFFVDWFYSGFDALWGDSATISPGINVSVSRNDAVVPESFTSGVGLAFDYGYFCHEFLVWYSNALFFYVVSLEFL